MRSPGGFGRVGGGKVDGDPNTGGGSDGSDDDGSSSSGDNGPRTGGGSPSFPGGSDPGTPDPGDGADDNGPRTGGGEPSIPGGSSPGTPTGGGSSGGGGSSNGPRGPGGSPSVPGAADPGTETVRETVGVGGPLGTDPAPPPGPEPVDDASIDRQGLDTIATGFEDNVAEPIGDAARFASPATELDRVIPGEPVGRSVENFNEGAIDVLNPGKATQSAIGLGGAVAQDTRNVVEQGPVEGSRENVRDARNAVERGVSSFGRAASQDPVGTLSGTAGGLAGGAVAGTALSRGVRGATGSGTGSSSAGGSGFDVDDLVRGDFAGNTRGQVDLAFGRRRDDTDTPDQTTVEQTIDADDEIDTISADEFVDQRTRTPDDFTDTELVDDIERAADEPAGRQRTPTQRAESRVPPADEFASPAARQREIDRLSQRFREEDMADLDNRVVPSRTGMTETTAGRFGLADTTFDAGIGAGVVGTAVDEPGAGALEAEPEATIDPDGMGGIVGSEDMAEPGLDQQGGDARLDTIADAGQDLGLDPDPTLGIGRQGGDARLDTIADAGQELGLDTGETADNTTGGDVAGGDLTGDTTAETVSETVPVMETVSFTETVPDATTTTDNVSDTVAETSGGTTATLGSPLARQPRRRTPRPDLSADSPGDDDMDIDPLGAVGADFENETIGFDAADDQLVDDLEDIDAGP